MPAAETSRDATVELIGWGGPPLIRAAEWLAERFGGDMDGVVVALPGARAGRRLAEHLTRRLGPSWSPPQILTAGVLTDRLLDVEGVPAGRMARTLAWAQALRALGARDLESLAPGDQGSEERRNSLAPWLRLGERVRGLFGELAAEGVDFDAAAEATRGNTLFEQMAESTRWRALSKAQSRMEALLEQAGRVDPHLGRRRAIEAGALVEPREVVLVGVTDMNGLLRRALGRLGVPLHALVLAPEERRGDFDAFGCLIPEAAIERGIDLPLERWHVAGTPDDQAARAVDVVASWDGRFRAEEITIGAADAEVSPYLKRRLASHGVRVRDAAGTPLARSLPARLLQAVSVHLARRTFADLATLVRHPDLEACLLAAGVENPVSRVDRYQVEHLPDSVAASKPVWLGKRREAMAALFEAVQALLGELAETGARPIRAWAEPIRRLLLEVYGGRRLAPDDEHDRELAEALRAVRETLDELEELPPALTPDARADEALDLVVRSFATRALAPPPARAGQPTIELFGWLELAFDDAPALVVTGFQDGLVPETINGDAFLPDGLRKKLGLLDNDRRLARDLFATELLLHSREEVAFVSGRWSRLGDPTLPSRIIFHGAAQGLVERVEHLFHDEGETSARGVQPEIATRELPRVAPKALEEIAVTSFRAFLESPYRFYLERMLRLDTVDDSVREMDPLRFGTLAHDVLEDFGREADLKDSANPDAIHAFLCDRVHALGRARFGKRPLPAVALQLAQLELRFLRFAELHAERAAQGWHVEHAEWSPAEGGAVARIVDGVPIRIRGRIDRIDTHPDGRWAIWDYKTGDRIPHPDRSHRTRDGRWKDLQLPLYCLLAAELGHERLPELGVVAIAREPAKCGFLAVSGWNAEVIEEALATADDVVRAIRAGELWHVGTWKPYEPVFQALCGVGLVGVPLDDEGEAQGA